MSPLPHLPFYTTKCPLCKVLLFRHGTTTRGERRSVWANHVDKTHPELRRREASLVADDMSRGEREGAA